MLPRTSEKWEFQQRIAVAINAVPSKKSTADRAIRWLSAALGSDGEVAAASLGFAVLVTEVLVTVVVVVVDRVENVGVRAAP